MMKGKPFFIRVFKINAKITGVMTSGQESEILGNKLISAIAMAEPKIISKINLITFFYLG